MIIHPFEEKPQTRATSWLRPMTRLQGNGFENFPATLDVILITHPRDEDDFPRLFSWSDTLTVEDRAILTKCLRPVFGEIIRSENINVGLLFLPVYAREMIDPRSRSDCRKLLQQDAMETVAASGAKIICLGGLTGALTHYGKQLLKSAEAHGITITTGHALTAISVLRTYLKMIEDLYFDPEHRQLSVLGLGSIGAAFARMLLHQDILPSSLVLIDKPNREDHILSIAQELRGVTDLEIKVELTLPDGSIRPDSELYRSSYIISAVSNPNIIDIDKISPYTVLIDDSQPYCWSREKAIRRCLDKLDIVPCEAGLVDCSSIGYVSRFPFDFSDHDESGSHTSWSCLTEGLVRHLHPHLPNILGEPVLEHIMQYSRSFDELGLKTPALQCGKHTLPIQKLKNKFAGQ